MDSKIRPSSEICLARFSGLVEVADLVEYDLIEAAERLPGLRAQLEGTEAGDAFARLAEHMDDFDMAGATEAVKEIAGMLSITLGQKPPTSS